MTDEEKRELLEFLVSYLAEERRAIYSPGGGTVEELWTLFRALVNQRNPGHASDGFYAAQDKLLQGLIAEAGVSTIDDALPSPADASIRLWRGDITTIRVDGIVNAANSAMLGCWVPGHHCIDNAIHTYAGIQLREECAKVMAAQGHEEPTGQAKVTAAWNLPSTYVIHTVGPIASGNPTDLHRKQLADCYRNCLDAAVGHDMRSVALCCISTGVFGFPEEEAAHTAVQTVRAWKKDHGDRDITVVFNVFGASSEAIYRNVLEL